MVALAIVFPDELPIRPLDEGRFECNLCLMQPVRQQIRLDLSPERLKVGSHPAQANPDFKSVIITKVSKSGLNRIGTASPDRAEVLTDTCVRTALATIWS